VFSAISARNAIPKALARLPGWLVREWGNRNPHFRGKHLPRNFSSFCLFTLVFTCQSTRPNNPHHQPPQRAFPDNLCVVCIRRHCTALGLNTGILGSSNTPQPGYGSHSFSLILSYLLNWRQLGSITRNNGHHRSLEYSMMLSGEYYSSTAALCHTTATPATSVITLLRKHFHVL
jgi:hypothetical protein